MNALAIVGARASDLAALSELLVGADLPLAGLADQFPGGYALAREAGAVLGAAGLEVYSHVGLLRSLVVAREARGRGLGRALIEDRLARAEQIGLAAVYVLTTTAAELFRRSNFVDANRAEAPQALQAAPEFAFACPSSAVCLRFALVR